MSSSSTTYENWTREELIARLKQLEHRKPSSTVLSKKTTPPRPQKAFDFSAHPRRKIAVKFSYNGSEYCGMEFQKTPTSLPTVEGVLYEAMAHTRFIDPAAGFEGCGWEKCGRTDRGVSAAGQVISLWVRSAIGEIETSITPAEDTEAPLQASDSLTPETKAGNEGALGLEGNFGLMGDWDEPPTNASRPAPTKSIVELNYISQLNNVLPPSIRVIAWSPVAPDFSARFSCKYRHYKYFFDPNGLDLAAMQDAANRLIGEHDFRNLCKIDASKQLTIFTRRIVSAQINPAQADGDLHVLDLIGTAFLYNQVRHIMAVLFLVGTRLENPSVIDALLNVDPEHPRSATKDGESPPLVVSGKPEYQMADPLPLVLWECGYDPSAVSWHPNGEANVESDEDAVLSHRDLSKNLYHGVQSLYTRSLIQTALDGHVLRSVARHHSPPPQYFPIGHSNAVPIPRGSVLSVPLGAGTFRKGANYMPLLERPRGDHPDLVNERWRMGKGARQSERRALAAQAAADGGDE